MQNRRKDDKIMTKYLPWIWAILITSFGVGGSWADINGKLKAEVEKRKIIYPYFEKAIEDVKENMSRIEKQTNEQLRDIKQNNSEEFKDIKYMLRELMSKPHHNHENK